MPEYRYPADIGTGSINSAIRITEYQRLTKDQSIPANTFVLYMPNDINCPLEIEYEEGSQLKMYGDMANWASKGLQMALDFGKSKTNSGSKANKIFSNASSILKTTDNSIRNTLSSFGENAETFKDSLSYFTEQVMNPGTILAFKGVHLRNFTMSFDFYPLSQKDTVTINKIITTLKAGALPEKQLDAGGVGLLTYPQEYQIEFLFNNEINPFMPVLKRCVITNCEANYTGESFWSMTRDGAPATIKLELEFKEVEMLMKEDYGLEFTKINSFIETFNGGKVENFLQNIDPNNYLNNSIGMILDKKDNLIEDITKGDMNALVTDIKNIQQLF